MVQCYSVSREAKFVDSRSLIPIYQIKCRMLHGEASFNRKLGMAALRPLSAASDLRENNISIHLFTRVSVMQRQSKHAPFKYISRNTGHSQPCRNLYSTNLPQEPKFPYLESFF